VLSERKDSKVQGSPGLLHAKLLAGPTRKNGLQQCAEGDEPDIVVNFFDAVLQHLILGWLETEEQSRPRDLAFGPQNLTPRRGTLFVEST
jgi:hypothetical protein